MSGLRYPLAPQRYSQFYENFRNQWIARSLQDRNQILRFALVPAIAVGQVSYTSSAAWATIRGAATGTRDYTVNPVTPHVSASTTTNEWDVMTRVAVYYDVTGLLRTESVVESARLLCQAGANVVSDFGGSLCVVDGPSTYPPIVDGDYDGFGTTEFATRIALSGITAQSGFAFVLNDNGIANISRAGVTSFGFRISSDLDNAEPTWVSGNNDSIQLAALFNDPSTGVPVAPPALEMLYYY